MFKLFKSNPVDFNLGWHCFSPLLPCNNEKMMTSLVVYIIYLYFLILVVWLYNNLTVLVLIFSVVQ